MFANLSNFKVVYDNRVLRALYLEEWICGGQTTSRWGARTL